MLMEGLFVGLIFEAVIVVPYISLGYSANNVISLYSI